MASTKPDAIPIFLSFSKPIFPAQEEFIRNLSEGLTSFGMKPRTLGVTVYDVGVPLTAIAQLMRRSAGLISVSFRRTHIEAAEKFDRSDGRPGAKEQIRDKWMTSPWPHIEVGMAFQIDLPILILRESGVIADGILEKGSSAFYLPTFDLDTDAHSYLRSDEWQHIFHIFYQQVEKYLGTCKIALLDEPPPRPWPLFKDELPPFLAKTDQNVSKLRDSLSPIPPQRHNPEPPPLRQPELGAERSTDPLAPATATKVSEFTTESYVWPEVTWEIPHAVKRRNDANASEQPKLGSRVQPRTSSKEFEPRLEQSEIVGTLRLQCCNCGKYLPPVEEEGGFQGLE